MEIQVSKDGPYLVKNVEKLTDHEGNEYEAKKTIALCRCGHSSDKPFCDGSHSQENFKASETAK